MFYILRLAVTDNFKLTPYMLLYLVVSIALLLFVYRSFCRYGPGKDQKGA